MEQADMIEKIRAAFPACTFTDIRFAEGQYNTVLVLDETWAFRFPKTSGYRATFEREVRLLRALLPLSPVPVPDYTYVSDEGFGGYRLLPGEPLTAARFFELADASQAHIIPQISCFLSTLHGIHPAIIGSHLMSEHQWDPDDLSRYTRRYMSDRRARIAPYIDPALLRAIDAFYPVFEQLIPAQRRVIHRDLRDAHILAQGGSVTGIIDFADAALGDPAFDFAYFWNWGEKTVDALLHSYAYPDERLRTRSHMHFVRYQIDQLFYAIRAEAFNRLPDIIESLRAHIPYMLECA